MDGGMMYEIARQRIADQHRLADRRRSARQAVRARKEADAAARRREARDAAVELPAIPDYAHELLGGEAGDAVPPRPAAVPDRPTATDR
jgi:hypothetical protein